MNSNVPTITRTELNHIAEQACRSTTCAVDGQAKRREDAFCLTCYTSLPKELQDDLWRGYRGTMQFRIDQYSKCFVFLKRKARLEREKLLEDVDQL